MTRCPQCFRPREAVTIASVCPTPYPGGTCGCGCGCSDKGIVAPSHTCVDLPPHATAYIVELLTENAAMRDVIQQNHSNRSGGNGCICVYCAPTRTGTTPP